jgi:uncharacterized protein YjbJ (UPF0337 family)
MSSTRQKEMIMESAERSELSGKSSNARLRPAVKRARLAGDDNEREGPQITTTGENLMKPSTHDQTHGKYHEVKGGVKERAGRATNNPNLEDEGTREKVAGKVQKKIGEVEKVLED